MYKIALVNMPFADPCKPALSLTQLKEVVSQAHDVEVDIHYLNQDIALELGLELYNEISNKSYIGLGDWLFRDIAFPTAGDNTDKYFSRHIPFNDPHSTELKSSLVRHKNSLDTILTNLVDELKLSEVDLVGFTSMFSQNTACFALANKLKEKNPEIITVVGGANCESPMGEEIARNVPQIDFVFSGPALVSFPTLVGHLINGDEPACHKIKGVISNKNSESLANDARVGEELPLDEYVHLDYRSFIEDFDSNFPDMKRSKMLLYETSRGCWWGERSHCTFCGLNSASMNYRSMKKDVALKQFDSMFKYADDCDYYLVVDNILPQNYLKEVIPEINPPENISIFYEVKSNLKEAEVELLSKKRIKLLQPGIEALSNSSLRLMRKGVTSFQNILFLKYCALYDVFPLWNMLVGFPGEEFKTLKKYIKDLPLLSHLPPPTDCFPVRFDRYSPYFSNPEEHGLELKPFEFYQFIYPFSQDSITNLAYYFQQSTYSSDFAVQISKHISNLKSGVSQWRARWKQDSDDSTGIHPQLYFEDKNRVYDSRTGNSQHIEISDKSRYVLDQLNKARSIPSLTTSTLGVDDLVIEDELEHLTSLGLVFEDEGKYLNLVFPRPGSELRTGGYESAL